MKLTLKHAVAAIILVLSFAAPLAAGPFEDAIVAHGRGDYATALRLMRPLANQGLAGAQYNLGQMYLQGQGVPQDNAEGAKWYRLAANRGYALAQYNLGVMYAKGSGVPQDDAEAMKWFRLAANQANASAQYNLGVKYSNGQGVPQDFVRAHMWYNLAAAQGNKDAVKNRDRTASRMTQAQIAEAQKLAREWKPVKPKSQ